MALVDGLRQLVLLVCLSALQTVLSAEAQSYFINPPDNNPNTTSDDNFTLYHGFPYDISWVTKSPVALLSLSTIWTPATQWLESDTIASGYYRWNGSLIPEYVEVAKLRTREFLFILYDEMQSPITYSRVFIISEPEEGSISAIATASASSASQSGSLSTMSIAETSTPTVAGLFDAESTANSEPIGIGAAIGVGASAAFAIVVASIIVFLRRRSHRHQEQKALPPPRPLTCADSDKEAISTPSRPGPVDLEAQPAELGIKHPNRPYSPAGTPLPELDDGRGCRRLDSCAHLPYPP